MNPSTALASTVVDELVRCGMTDAVLAPGSRSAALALALAEDPRVRLHVRIDERSAAFTALGLARATGRPAAVVCTSGSAAANLHPAVVEADTGRVPLLLLTADRPPELRAAGANQTIDQLGLFGRAVRWFTEVGAPEGQPGAGPYWRSTTCHAWAAATGGQGDQPGPVHVNLAFREPLVPAPDDGAFDPAALAGRDGGRPWAVAAAPGREPPTALVARVAERLRAVERGLLVAGDGAGGRLGGGAGGSGPQPARVDRLARRLGWPVLAEPTAGVRVGEHAVDCHDLLLRVDAFAQTHEPELIVVLGRANLSRSLARRWPQVPRVVVDAQAVWADPARTATDVLAVDPAALVGAVDAALAGHAGADPATGASATREDPNGPGETRQPGLSEEPGLPGEPGEWGPWARSWREAGRRARAAVDALLDADPAADAAATEPRLARDVGAWLSPGATLVVASSMPIRDLATYARRRDDVRVLANRGASGIDGFVSTAVGAALGCDGGPTVALAGDLSLLHDANGLLLRGQPTPDLVLVVADNDGGGIFSLLPQAGFPERFEQVFGTPHGVDMAALAAVSGTGYRRLRRAADLPATLDEARSAGGLQMVHVRTDRQDNRRLHEALARAAAEALGAPPGAVAPLRRRRRTASPGA